MRGTDNKAKLKHVIEAKQFSERKMLQEIFSKADDMAAKDAKGKLPQSLKGKRVASFFYEESTRTRFSFEAAILALGGKVVSTEKASQFSSVAKGETLTDTIKILNCYVHAIIMRHNIKGSAKIASETSKVPVINAGDGQGEHPTQALLDIYTIQKEIGRIDNLSIAMIGDLRYGRTVHSLVYLLESCKGVKIYFVSPKSLRMPEEYLKGLKDAGIQFEETEDLNKVLDKVDILYVTRIQKERFENPEEYEKVKGYYTVNKETLKKIKKDAIIMHPLPRVTEIDPEIDDDPRAAYFRQARNGLYIRMALLDIILG
ncbi:aspartate carbamoyltransferase [Candidatus Woesearchaeota archaeon]|nr:aspartate carbamoyltransferase [Candidatus Woesearchaeota archaeon]